MELYVVQYRFVSICHKFLLLFFFILMVSFPPLFTSYASAQEAQQQVKGYKERKISVLQTGINLIKQEIKRDKAIASAGIRLSRNIREVRKTLKVSTPSKEQLIADLQSWLPSRLSAEINALQETLDQEKEISEGVITSSRVRRLTHETIEKMIPVKEGVLATFEEVLAELKQNSP